MIEAQCAPTEGRFELAAELEKQGIQIDWRDPGGPVASTSIDFAYDAPTHTFRVIQKPA